MSLLRVASASPMAGWQGKEISNLQLLHHTVCDTLSLRPATLDEAVTSLAALLDEPAPKHHTKSGKLRHRSVYSADYEWHPCVAHLTDRALAIAWKVADYLMLERCSRALCEVAAKRTLVNEYIDVCLAQAQTEAVSVITRRVFKEQAADTRYPSSFISGSFMGLRPQKERLAAMATLRRGHLPPGWQSDPINTLHLPLLCMWGHWSLLRQIHDRHPHLFDSHSHHGLYYYATQFPEIFMWLRTVGNPLPVPYMLKQGHTVIECLIMEDEPELELLAALESWVGPEAVRSSPAAINAALLRGDVLLAQSFLDKGFAIAADEVFHFVAEGGSVAAADWACATLVSTGNGLPSTDRMMRSVNAALERCHLAYCEWVLAKLGRTSLKRPADEVDFGASGWLFTVSAVRSGQLEAVEWTHAHGAPLVRAACRLAEDRHYDHMLTWWQANGMVPEPD